MAPAVRQTARACACVRALPVEPDCLRARWPTRPKVAPLAVPTPSVGPNRQSARSPAGSVFSVPRPARMVAKWIRATRILLRLPPCSAGPTPAPRVRSVESGRPLRVAAAVRPRGTSLSWLLPRLRDRCIRDSAAMPCKNRVMSKSRFPRGILACELTLLLERSRLLSSHMPPCAGRRRKRADAIDSSKSKPEPTQGAPDPPAAERSIRGRRPPPARQVRLPPRRRQRRLTVSRDGKAGLRGESPPARADASGSRCGRRRSARSRRPRRS